MLSKLTVCFVVLLGAVAVHARHPRRHLSHRHKSLGLEERWYSHIAWDKAELVPQTGDKQVLFGENKDQQLCPQLVREDKEGFFFIKEPISILKENMDIYDNSDMPEGSEREHAVDGNLALHAGQLMNMRQVLGMAAELLLDTELETSTFVLTPKNPEDQPLTLRQRFFSPLRTLYDMKRNEEVLLSIYSKIISWGEWRVCASKGGALTGCTSADILYRCHRSGSMTAFWFGTEFICRTRSVDGKDGDIVATVSKKGGGLEEFGKQVFSIGVMDRYLLRVAPGVDPCVFLGFIVAYDEYKDTSKRSGGALWNMEEEKHNKQTHKGHSQMKSAKRTTMKKQHKFFF